LFIMFLNFLFSGLFLSLKEFLFQEKHAVIEKPHVWKLFKKYSDAQRVKTESRGVFVMRRTALFAAKRNR